ncbi:Uma2 family endonuclease [Pseudonocardia nantongensis]|uniref:Uma2 family endonuclease n=1 Tax=Pseudonocardia nantongensis TaxID=1181885 RepID=UPI0039782F51
MAAPHQYEPRTAADLRFEPDDGLRRELHDGVVHVVPPPSDDHAWRTGVVCDVLRASAPDDVYLLQNVGVHTGLRRLYVPDLTVVYQGTPYHDFGYDPGGVLLVVEVVSPSSVTLDRRAKPGVYAEQGVPFFWRVDDGPRLQAFRLDPASGEYVPATDLGPRESGEAAAPWPVHVDTAELVMPHKRP